MKSTYKTSTNYYKVLNKKIPAKKNIYKNILTDPNYFNHDFKRNNGKYIPFNEENNLCFFISKALSKKKKRGILDISSPGNKDVLTDSDSELPPSKKSKNKEFVNENNSNKTGCAKLIIEKVESQVPKKNEEYYKFTNQKRVITSIDLTNINNTGYSNNQYIGYNTAPNKNDQSSFNSKIKSINSNRNSMTQNRGYTNQIGYQDTTNKIMEKKYIIHKNNYLNPNYKKFPNHNPNRILISDPTSKEKNYFLNERNSSKKNYLDLTGSKNGKMYIGFQINRSPINYKSTETSFDKDYKSLNYLKFQNSNKKNSTTRNEFSTPVPSYTSNDDVYSNKRALNLKKNLLNHKPNKTISLYNKYDNLAKRPTINQLINLNYNAKGEKTYIQNKFNEKLIKSITKIQSYWRGFFIRELMSFVHKLNKFMEILYKLFQNNKKKNFFYFLNILNNLEKPKKKRISVGFNMKAPSFRQKYLINKDKNEKNDNLSKRINSEESIKAPTLSKEEDYNYLNLLKNYNSLMDKYNNLMEEMNNMKKSNKFENLDIDKNKLDIIVKKMIKNEEKKKIKENKKEIIQNIDNNKNKKFDLIQPEQNEGFKIIQKSNSNNDYKLRVKRNSKKRRTENIQEIEKVSEIEFHREKDKNDNEQNITYDDFLSHFMSNINISNNDQFIIKEVPKINKKIINKEPFYISNNEQFIIKESPNKEPFYISNNEQFIIKENPNVNKNIINKEPFFISNNSLSLISKKSQKGKKRHSNKDNKKNNEDNQNAIEEKEKTPKIFNNISINKDKENEISIIIVKKKEKKKKKSSKKIQKQHSELIEENQANLNIEIKGLENTNKNDIDSNQLQKQKEFDNEQLFTKNEILINIISENKPQSESETQVDKKINNMFNNESLTFDNKTNLIFLSDIIQKDKNEEKKDNNEIKSDSIEEKNREKKLKEIFMIDNNNILYIKRLKKRKFDKMTEITEELNKIEPNNHYELIFKGKINLNENLETNKNEDKNENEPTPKEEKEKNFEEEKSKKNYNEENEVDKGNGLEINPIELKNGKTPNNIIISYEKNIEVLYNKNPTFTEKAKKNIMRIILPIRLKTTLREYVRKKVFPFLIKSMKTKK